MASFRATDGSVLRRTFLSLLGVAAGGIAAADSTIEPSDVTVSADELRELSFYSTAGQVGPNGEELDDDEHVVVRASEDAFVTIAGEDTDSETVTEYENAQIPLVSQDGNVMGIGTANFVTDDNGGFTEGNEQFLLNAWDELMGGGTVLWDESHGQFWSLDKYSSFETYVEDQGYEVDALSEFDAGGGVEAIEFYSTASQVAPDGSALTDEETIAVWAEDTAENVDADGNGDAFEYGDDPIPLVSTDGSTVGFGAMLVNDASGYAANEEFVQNVWDDLLGSGVVLFDDGHEQFYDSSEFTDFAARVEDDGYVVEPTTDLANDGGPVLQLELDTVASQIAPDGSALTDEETIVAWAEETAENTDSDGNGDAYAYEDERIPVISNDGGVVGFGSILVEDANGVDPNNVAFLLNVWDAELDGETVLWDQGHGQFYSPDDVSEFLSAAGDDGYDVRETTDLLADLDDADGLVVTDPADAFSEDELAAIADFVAAGGSLFLHDQGDYNDFDATDNLNAIADELDLAFRFNDDQVEDETRNKDGLPFVPKTSAFNEAFDYLGDGEPAIDRADGIVITSPSAEFSTEELDALSDFVADGGAVFLHDQADNNDYDATANLNAIADELDLAFRFNDDQVEDDATGFDSFVFETSNVNDAFDYFGGSGGASLEEAAGLVVTTPASAFTDEELATLSAFVDDGGALFLFDQSDFGDNDETANLNAIADELDLAFRFNGGQVEDEVANTGSEFDIVATEFTDGFDYFADREGIAISFDPDEEYYGRVIDLADGDTFTVEFEDSEYGHTEVIRTLAIDTAETGNTSNTPEKWVGIDDEEHIDEWGDEGTGYAEEALIAEGDKDDVQAGHRVKVSFDPGEGTRGNFGRLLAYVHYDPDDPDADELPRNYNRELVEEGYARVYSSGFADHDEYAAIEEDAIAEGRGIWEASDVDALDEIRNDPVEELFFPQAATVAAGDGSAIDPDAVPVWADGEATIDGGDSPYDGGEDLPLVGVDEDARVGVVGSIVIDENYEADEGYDVDTSGYGNYPFLTNLAAYLSERDGDVIIEGGHGQFGADGAVSQEGAQFYQRFLEGVGSRFRQINDLPETLPAEEEVPLAVIVTPPADPYTDEELEALANYRASGGAVLLLGSPDASDDARANLNAIAEALDADVSLSGDRVVDASNNVNDDEAVPVTSRFDDSYPLFDPYDPDERDDEVDRYLELIANDDGEIDDAALERAIEDWAAGRTERRHLEAAMDAYEAQLTAAVPFAG